MNISKYSKKLGTTKGRAKYLLLWFIPFIISLALLHFKVTHLGGCMAVVSGLFIIVRSWKMGQYDIAVFEQKLNSQFPNSNTYGTH